MNTKLIDEPTDFEIKRKEYWYVDWNKPTLNYDYTFVRWHIYEATPKTSLPKAKYFRNEDL